MTVNDQSAEKWESCFVEYFLFEIYLGADTIQKYIASSIFLYIFVYFTNLMTRMLNLKTRNYFPMLL